MRKAGRLTTLMTTGTAAIAMAMAVSVFVSVPLPLPGSTVVGASTTSGSDGGGSVTVGATGGEGGAPSPTPGTDGGGGPGAGGSGGSGTSPWSCQDFPLVGNDAVDPPGGPLPGGWFEVICNDPSASLSTETTEWISSATPAPAAAPAPPDPYQVALAAERSLVLPVPTLNFDPAGSAVVNLPTYLWIDGVPWGPESVSASVGGVTATAVATPTAVTWSLGDGTTLTCGGPGVDVPPGGAPATGTACVHTYTEPSVAGSAVTSAGVPAFVVTATVHWAVGWTSVGVAGGGALPGLVTTGTATLPVAQIESVETAP